MRRLTRKSLSELAQKMPVLSEEVQSSYIGGGDGSKKNPFTMEEYISQSFSFKSGWVDLHGNNNPEYMTCCYHYYSNYGSGSFLGYSGFIDNSGNYYGNFGSYSILPDSCTANNIDGLIAQLPLGLWDELSGKIIVRLRSDISNPAQYDAISKTIYLKTFNFDAFYRECIHAIQDLHGYGGTNHAAKEFQEHVIGDVMSILRDKNSIDGKVNEGKLTTVFGADYPSSFKNWIISCVDARKGVDMHKFKQGIDRYLSDFQKSHSNYKKYQGHVPSDYDYNWEEMFYLMGIRTY